MSASAGSDPREPERVIQFTWRDAETEAVLLALQVVNVLLGVPRERLVALAEQALIEHGLGAELVIGGRDRLDHALWCLERAPEMQTVLATLLDQLAAWRAEPPLAAPPDSGPVA